MSRPELLYLVPGTAPDEAEQRRRQQVATECSPTDVEVAWVGTGPRGIESTADEAWSVPGLLRTAVDREDAFDAVVVGCFGDPGLRALRELLSIPVVGPAETAVYTALQLSDRFSVLTPLDRTVPMSRSVVAELGVESSLASVRSLDRSIEDIEDAADGLAGAMVETGRLAVTEDGAEALLPGCMSLAFAREHTTAQERLPVPFLDPLTLALEQANSWARMGLVHSDRSYPPADRDRLERLFE